MIADVKKNSSLAELKKYVNYCISPKKETGNEPAAEKARRKELRQSLKKADRVSGERVAAFHSDEMEARPSQVDGFVAQLDAWTISQKRGRPATAATPRAIMGTFAWDPSDKITPERAVELTRESLKKEMGDSYRPGLFVCHQDTEHLHVHFVVAAVGADGLVYDPAGRGQLYRRMEMVMEGLETTHGFKRVQQRKAMEATDYTRAVVVAAPKGVDLQKAERTGKATPDMILRARVITAFSRNMGNMDDFLQALDRAGVRWKANVKEGRVAGLSFGLANAPADHNVAAGKLGKAFAWGALSKTMQYDYAYHFDMMRTHGREGIDRLVEQGGKAPDMAEVPRRREPVPEAPVAPLVAPPAVPKTTAEQLADEDDALAERVLRDDGWSEEDIVAVHEVARAEGMRLGEWLTRPKERDESDGYLPDYQVEAVHQMARATAPRGNGTDYTRGLTWDTNNEKTKGDDYGFGY